MTVYLDLVMGLNFLDQSAGGFSYRIGTLCRGCSAGKSLQRGLSAAGVSVSWQQFVADGESGTDGNAGLWFQ